MSPGFLCDRLQAMTRKPKPLDVLIVYLLVLAYILYGGYLFSRSGNKWFALLFSAGLGAVPFAYSLACGYDLRDVFAIAVPDKRQAGGGILLMAGVSLFLVMASIITGFFLPVKTAAEIAVEKQILDRNFLFGLLSVVLLPAVFEEFFCRGFILSGLRDSLPKWPAIILCGALFAFLHFDPVRVPFTFAAGLAITWAAWQSRSILIPVGMHFLHNLLLFAALRVTGPDMAAAAGLRPGSFLEVPVLIAAVALLAFAGFLVFTGRDLLRKKSVFPL